MSLLNNSQKIRARSSTEQNIQIFLEMLRSKKVSLKCIKSLYRYETRYYQLPRAYPGWIIRDRTDTEYSVYGNKYICVHKKSRIRETKHLSTDADSSTDTTVGWTKNTQKPNFFEKRKKSSKTQKLKTA